MWWTVRLGGAAGALLVSVPTWQFVDPLPVLTRPPRPEPSEPQGPDPQNEEAAAAEVLGRDLPDPPRTGAAGDDSLDTTAGRGARR